MKCCVCGLLFSNRPALLFHLTECHKGMDTDDSSVPDDSDADPCWSPGSQTYVSEASSPLTKEQMRVSAEAESLVQDWEVNETYGTVVTETASTEADNKKCYCGTMSVRIPVKEGKEKGRIFLTCEKPPEKRCHFFEWLDESKNSKSLTIDENVMNSPVPAIQQKEIPKKRYKQYFCPFCSNLVDHFPRHLLNKHKTEEEVKLLKNLAPKSVERTKLIAKIRGRGSIIYNTSDDLNKGVLISARRGKEVKDKSLKPCTNCYNYFQKTSLWKHFRKCTGKSAPRDLQQRSEAILLKTTAGNDSTLSSSLRDILPGMDRDEVYNQIIKDEAIKDFGNFMCLKHNENHLKNMIRTKLRQVSKTLLEIKTQNPLIEDLDAIFHPTNYDTFINAVKAIALKGDRFTSPSFVGEVGRTMKLIANRRIIYNIKKGNEEKKAEIEKWLHIFNNDYYNTLGRNALRALQKKKWGKSQLVPYTEDVMKLNIYLNEKVATAANILKKEFNMEAFNSLNKCLMTQIQIFNRRRSLEIEKFSVSDFEKRHNIQKDSVFYKTLTASEKILSEKYMRVETRGKQHRKPAAMLLTTMQVDLIGLILQYRKEADVDEENPHIFARKKRTFGAYAALKEAAYASNAEQPDLLIGTLLRKQMATTAQALNFTENDMVNLANFMGHDLSTHREFYRIPNEAIHLAKISKLLMAMDEGSIDKFHGKTLDEIDVTNVNIGEDIDDTLDHTELQQSPLQSPAGRNSQIHTPTKTKNKASQKHSWNTPERQLVRKIFHKFLKPTEKLLPTPAQCRVAIQKNKELHGLTIGQVKGWVFSERKRLLKKD